MSPNARSNHEQRNQSNMLVSLNAHRLINSDTINLFGWEVVKTMVKLLDNNVKGMSM